jgi:16S rRNA processing protein RimM
MGEVYVVVISDDPRRFEPGSRLLTADDQALEIESRRGHGSRLLVKFHGVSSRDEADSLRGPLYVPSEDARSLEDGEFWPFDLVGCEVYEEGELRGTVTEVRPGAAQDLLIIDTAAGERMIPLVKEIVTSVQTDNRRIDVTPPEGLLE